MVPLQAVGHPCCPHTWALQSNESSFGSSSWILLRPLLFSALKILVVLSVPRAITSVLRCSNDPRACPGGMGVVLWSPVGKERWLGTAEVEGAEWKEVTGGHRETLLVRNRRGREG